MNKHVLSYIGLLFFLLFSVLPSATGATPAMTLIPPPKSSPVQPIAEQLGAQLQSLVSPAPAPAATDENSDENIQEPPPTFGTRALNAVINITQILRAQASRFIMDFSALPQLSDWLAQQKNDPRLVARWQATGNDIITTAGMAFLGALALEFLLFPLRRALRQRRPHIWTARVAVVFSLFSLRAIPIIVFIAASVMLLDQYETQKLPRFLILNIVYALALARVTVSFLRGIFSPRSEILRFVPASTSQAVYGFRWLRAYGLLIVFGYFCIDVARAVRVPEAAVGAFINLLGLALVVMSIIVIAQIRSFVASLLRGNLSAAQRDLSWVQVVRLWLARRWHILAIGYLVVGYVIAVLGIHDGLAIMLRGTFLMLLVLVVARLMLGEINRWELSSRKAPATMYVFIKGVVLRLLVAVFVFVASLAAWGADLTELANSSIGHRVLGAGLSIGVTLLILGIIYEFFSSAVDRRLQSRLPDGTPIPVSPRVNTLLPMMRNAVFLLFMVIIGMVIMSEAGINIGPLLAGAGVLGVAVGFGSQTLVKDFLTGLFIVLENTIAIGDVIKIGEHSGVVEAMSMRTLRLRDLDGALHIIPFSEVSQIVNLTRGFAHAVIKINVATDTDLDRAIQSMKAVGAELQNEPAYKHQILSPVDVWGVDSINDTSITLMAIMRTQPGQQWGVKRVFLLRLKQRFDKEGIRLPNWTMVRLENDKNS